VDQPWLELLLIAALILLNGSLAGTEIALVSLREGQLHRLEGASRRGRALARLARAPTRFLTTIQVGITLAGFMAAAVAAVTVAERLAGVLAFLGRGARPVAVLMITVAVTFATLVFGELAPKRLAMQRAERWGLAAARPLTTLSRLARPVVWLLGTATDMVVRLAGGDPSRRGEDVTEAELKDLVVSQTTFTPDERDIISGAFELTERTLREVLVPRPAVVALAADTQTDTALEQLLAAGHTRAPVYRRDLDDIVGVVHLRRLIDGGGTVTDHVQPVVVFPESAGVISALRRLQQEQQHLAVVIDEHGSVAGLVTIEDLVEEVVGEIWNETDKDVRTVVHEPDGSVTLPGTFPIHDLTDIGIALPEGNYTTVAGLVLDRLGHLPVVGEQVRVDGWRVEVRAVDEHAITRLTLHPSPDWPKGR
jgi:putative hemolysin